ncbi:MAG: hypothetical protein HOP33_12675 [Verrucomicrobia bacterium]|nr:hypothetical protein [Verrucomicrobiota bacterium]
MTIELPDHELGSLNLTTEQARVEVAIGLYASRQVALGRAAKIAGLPKVLFMREMARHGIGMHYSMEQALDDLRMADELSLKVRPS